MASTQVCHFLVFVYYKGKFFFARKTIFCARLRRVLLTFQQN